MVFLVGLATSSLVIIFGSLFLSKVYTLCFIVWPLLTHLMHSVYFCLGWLGVYWPCSGQTHCKDGVWTLWETVLSTSARVVPDFQGGRKGRGTACRLWASSGEQAMTSSFSRVFSNSKVAQWNVDQTWPRVSKRSARIFSIGQQACLEQTWQISGRILLKNPWQ